MIKAPLGKLPAGLLGLPSRYIVTCDMTYALNLIGGRWKLLILTQLKKGALRFGELKKRIPQVTERMLTLQLREMEAEGIVQRTVYPEAPPRVEYALTTISERLLLICHQLSAWGTEHRQAHPVPASGGLSYPPFSRRWSCATSA